MSLAVKEAVELDGKCPSGPIAERWTQHKREMKLVAPNNRRKYTIIVVGTGLAGGSAAASLAELGYNVLSFCLQDTPRRAQGSSGPAADLCDNERISVTFRA